MYLNIYMYSTSYMEYIHVHVHVYNVLDTKCICTILYANIYYVICIAKYSIYFSRVLYHTTF